MGGSRPGFDRAATGTPYPKGPIPSRVSSDIARFPRRPHVGTRLLSVLKGHTFGAAFVQPVSWPELGQGIHQSLEQPLTRYTRTAPYSAEIGTTGKTTGANRSAGITKTTH